MSRQYTDYHKFFVAKKVYIDFLFSSVSLFHYFGTLRAIQYIIHHVKCFGNKISLVLKFYSELFGALEKAETSGCAQSKEMRSAQVEQS
jgi:hypothetical protein